MSSRTTHTTLEELIAEARSAEKAGVFGRTRLDVSALAEEPAPSRIVRFYERALVGLPLAACLAIVIGIAAMSGTVGDGRMGGSSGPLAVLDQPAGQSDLCSIELMEQCVSGPGTAVANGCGMADLDSDGDVDLSDYSSYQRMAANLH